MDEARQLGREAGGKQQLLVVDALVGAGDEDKLFEVVGVNPSGSTGGSII